MQDILSESVIHFIRINREDVEKLFTEIRYIDYVQIQDIIRDFMPVDSESKIYLRDIAETHNLPMNVVSMMVKNLNDHGLVTWTHDGKGENGTYIQLPQDSLDLIEKQGEIVQSFYKAVATKYGTENLLSLIHHVESLQKIVSDEIQNYI